MHKKYLVKGAAQENWDFYLTWIQIWFGLDILSRSKDEKWRSKDSRTQLCQLARGHTQPCLLPHIASQHPGTEVFQQILVLCFKTVSTDPQIQEMYSEVFRRTQKCTDSPTEQEIPRWGGQEVQILFPHLSWPPRRPATEGEQRTSARRDSTRVCQAHFRASPKLQWRARLTLNHSWPH